jgi:hypothetical protein
MRLLIAICISVVLAAAQDAKPAAKNAKAAAPEKPLTAIPASAVEIEPGAYRYTDAKGKKWILFQTPFGIARKEDTGEPLRKKLQEARTMQGVKITEDGDSLKFERQGPFGMYRWTKKKSDLDEEEKAAWESQKAGKDAAADAAKGSAPAAKSAPAKQDR